LVVLQAAQEKVTLAKRQQQAAAPRIAQLRRNSKIGGGPNLLNANDTSGADRAAAEAKQADDLTAQVAKAAADAETQLVVSREALAEITSKLRSAPVTGTIPARESSPQGEATVRTFASPAQAGTIAVLTEYSAKYKAATNELQKSALRTERKAALEKACPTRSAVDWSGVLKKMGTTSDGQAHVQIEIGGPKCTVSNLYPGFDFLITHGTPLYTQVAAIPEGAKVIFSGEFVQSDKDWVKEIQLGEAMGMEMPQLLINFSSISQVK
jgi:hypothetical protein